MRHVGSSAVPCLRSVDRKHDVRRQRKPDAGIRTDGRVPLPQLADPDNAAEANGPYACLPEQDVGHDLVVAWRRSRTVQQEGRIVTRRVLSVAPLDRAGDPVSCCDGNVFRAGSAATAMAAEPAAKTADASRACERFFMILLPSGW